MPKYSKPAINRASGSAPATFIESNLQDLKGNPISNRVLKDDWGTDQSALRKSMNEIVNGVRNQPSILAADLSMTKGRGFTPAGTTTDVNPSRVTRVKKQKETYAQKHAFGSGQLFRAGKRGSR